MVNLAKRSNSSVYSLMWLFLAIIIYYIPTESTWLYHNMMTWLSLGTYIFSLFNWVKRGNRVVSLFTIFVVYSLFSNVGQSILFSFGIDDLPSKLYNNYNLFDICQMLKYQFLCAAGFNYGVCLYLRKPYRNVSQKDAAEIYRNINHGKVLSGRNFIYEVLLIVSFVSVFIYTIYQIRLRRVMSYSDLYNTREMLSQMFSYGTIVLGFFFIFKKRHVNLILLMWLWFLVAYFVAGTRSMGIVYFGALLFMLPIVKPELFSKKTYLVWGIVAVLGLASINIISEMRTSSLGSAATVSSDAGLAIALFNSINEMGASEYPTMITMDEVAKGFGHPQTFLYFILLGFVPSNVLDYFVPSSWSVQLGTWATQAADSYNTELGYSWIAESFMNFGAFGWIFTLFYGWFIAMAENYSIRRIRNGQVILAFCLLAYLCKQIFFARGQIYLSISFYRYSIYLIVLCLLFRLNKKGYSKIQI